MMPPRKGPPMDRRGSHLSRREFVAGAAGLGLVAGCGRLPWQAEHPTKPARVPRVGFLHPESISSTSSEYAAFLQALRELGYAEGTNLGIEARWADGNLDRVPELAAELADMGVDVLVVTGDYPIRIARQMTSVIPIVMVISSDPVGLGHVAGLARPGANVTGLSFLNSGIASKRVQLLKETVPGASLAVYLRNPDAPSNVLLLPEIEAAARALGVSIHTIDVRTAGDLEGAFASAAREQADMLIVAGSALIGTHRARIVELAAQNRISAMYESRRFTEAGGLMSYGPSQVALYQRAAYYVDRILKGAKPADLPVEQPMRFDFVVNLKTAGELGITFPREILLQVTEVVE
jgi:putative tryptophan/tyrosine transport system substrate-binding protein